MYNYEFNVNYDTMDGYQEQFLKVFNVSSYDENEIARIRQELYQDLNKMKNFTELFEKALSLISLENNDTEWGMLSLFQYDYFDKFHECIKLFYTNKDDTTLLISKIDILNELL
tara:strand:+ start:588 stop:929 length:342 start_codon:yes stop_codon:yes gene_type:complete